MQNWANKEEISSKDANETKNSKYSPSCSPLSNSILCYSYHEAGIRVKFHCS